VTIQVKDNLNATNTPAQTFTITVIQENASNDYTGDSIGLTGANLTLQATVWDSAASGYSGANLESGTGATKGDITKMWIKFDIWTTTLTPTLVGTKWAQVVDTGTAGDGIGTATAAWASTSEGSYTVKATLVNATNSSGANLFYAAVPAEEAVITFYNNTGQFVTGGGWLTDPNGSHGNFGFNARYNKSGQPQGQMVYVYRGTYNGVPADFKIKSSSLSALSFTGTAYPLSGTLQGKGVIQITKTSDGTLLYSDGGASFVAKATDTGLSSGIGSDKFELTVYDKNGALYKSVPATLLQGGNVVIHLQ
jgi:hypothetical protein